MNDFKEVAASGLVGGFSAIQNDSDLSQGLKPAIGGTVEHKDGGHLGASSSRRKQIKLPAITRRCAMNMSVTQFGVAPAMVGRNLSVWREIIATVIEGPSRTAADEIDEYLARHQYDLSPALRTALERRHVCV
jgi:hypothetical protein